MKSTLLIAALLSVLQSYSQGVITLVRGSTTTLETRLDTAIKHAQSGDYIYLPGGLIAGSGGTIVINKKLAFIGAGYHNDSAAVTSPTLCPINFEFDPGSEGSFVTGISFYTTNSIIIFYTSNIIFTRCKFPGLSFYGNTSNILIEENIIDGTITGNSNALLSNTIIKKNIVYGSILSGLSLGNMSFSNNIFISASSLPSNNLFENNIFLASGTMSTNNSYCTKNLCVGTIANTGNNSGNISNEPLANIFINYTSGSPWNTSQDFHLKVGCRGIGAGTDGKDVGIYGTASPFKEGGIPFNPHYQSISIPNSTNSTGKLDVNITVKAQDH